MAADTVYSPKIKAGVAAINSRCNRWDATSKYVSVPGKYHWKKGRKSNDGAQMGPLPAAAFDVYGDKQGDKPYVCVSKVRYTFRCSGNCDIRTKDSRFPKNAVYETVTGNPRVGKVNGEHNYNLDKQFTVRISDFSGASGAIMWKSHGDEQILEGTSLDTDVWREGMEVYVVPGCNCAHRLVSGSWKAKTDDPTSTTRFAKEACSFEDVNAIPAATSGMPRPAIGVVCCDSTGKGSRMPCGKASETEANVGNTYNEALQHCAKRNLDLCTAQQLKDGAGQSSGCWYNHNLQWTKDTCTP